MSARKTLWIVSGGIEALPGIEQAKALGLYVVVSDGRSDAPGFALADDAVVASTYDVEETVAAAVRYHRTVRPVDGVVCIASDVPVTVAAVADALGLPGIPVEAARLATDKLAMKQRFHADGVPVPWFAAVASARELAAHAAAGRPLIVKPVDSRGSRGVLRLTAGVDLTEAFETAQSFSATGRVMVEEFLTGPQVSTETIVVDGVAVTPGFSDRNYELLDRYAPNVIENGGDQPSRLPADQQAAVREVVGRAAASLGVRDGVVKGDIVVHEGRAYVIELAARLSGGWFCTHQIPLSTGVSTLEATIRLALGEPVDPAELEPRRAVPVAQRYVFPAPGEVVAVHGVERARQLPGIEEVVVSARPGDVLLRPTDSNAAAGMVIAVGSSRSEARARAEAAVAAIHVETRQAA
jgi:biotin carboxylase